jgi:hypothetical protein
MKNEGSSGDRKCKSTAFNNGIITEYQKTERKSRENVKEETQNDAQLTEYHANVKWFFLAITTYHAISFSKRERKKHA